MICLVPGCGLSATPCGFCAGCVATIPVPEREGIVERWERLSGEQLDLAPQAPATQGELFGAAK
jgi:hypothetical protein